MKVCKYCETLAEDEAKSCPSCGAADFSHQCAQCGEVFDSAFCPRCGLQAGTEPRICPHCGTRYHTSACPTCGYLPLRDRAPAEEVRVVERVLETYPAASPKSRLAALLLVLFLGILGIHRFYVGKVGTGILYFFTAGFFGIGWLIDLILIVCGVFRDRRGLPLRAW
ncbi:MAG: NINE protein [Oscillospiraceae bacterium]|nr:NINE protein [Oscillospiraceae bacterium]